LKRTGESSKRARRERTGIFTSGVVAIWEGHRIALFFTGRQHAGENLRDVLAKRAAELGRPIPMPWNYRATLAALAEAATV